MHECSESSGTTGARTPLGILGHGRMGAITMPGGNWVDNVLSNEVMHR